MNTQQLKSKISTINIVKATFDNDEYGEPVNSFFRPLSCEGKQIELKLNGLITNSPKRYETNFGNDKSSHFSFAVKLEPAAVSALEALLARLYEGTPEDEEWISKSVTTPKQAVIIKLPTNKKMEFTPLITGTTITPFSVEGENTDVGGKVSLVVGLGCWFMRNRENKYGKGIK